MRILFKLNFWQKKKHFYLWIYISKDFCYEFQTRFWLNVFSFFFFIAIKENCFFNNRFVGKKCYSIEVNWSLSAFIIWLSYCQTILFKKIVHIFNIHLYKSIDYIRICLHNRGPTAECHPIALVSAGIRYTGGITVANAIPTDISSGL